MLGVWRSIAGCVEKCVRKEAMLGVWRKHCWAGQAAGCVENQCWVCGEVCKEAMLGVGEAVSSVGKTLQRADKRV